MNPSFSSRDRLLAAINCKEPDHIPLSFMIFTALNERLKLEQNIYDPREAVRRQLEMGIDTIVDLRTFSSENRKAGHSDVPGFPVHFHKDVTFREWADISDIHPYPVLHRQYETPAGQLSVIVNQTADWPYGNATQGKFHVPFLDDYLAPRSKKFLVGNMADLERLQFLFQPPSGEEIKQNLQKWNTGRKIAVDNDLLVSGGWGVGGDALAWLCGLENALIWALEDPEFLIAILQMVHNWNLERMKVFLDFGVDLFIRRAWYEGTDFWSPELFMTFFAPALKKEIQLTHEAGAKFGYIMTSGSAQLHSILIDLGIDVLIGVDPVQGKETVLEKTHDDLKGKICIWGGINGFITVEEGSKEEIRQAVEEAMDVLGPDGFILSPVDNVRDPSDRVWDNIQHLVNTWKKIAL